jgi:hypothetical protein
MIVAQRVYQANSQSIKVQDTVLQTLISLRREGTHENRYVLRLCPCCQR